jgi:hypothetical protein
MKETPYTFKQLILVLFVFLATTLKVVAQQTDVQTYFHDPAKVRQVMFSADGKFLATKTGEAIVMNKGVVVSPSVQLWELETGKKVMVLADKELGRASAFSQDGLMLAYREKNKINIMELNTQRIISSIQFNDKKTAFARPIAFTADNKSLIIEQGAGSSLYSVESGQFERDFYTKGLNPAKSSDDRYMIKSFVDNFCLYDFQTAKELHTFYCGTGKTAAEQEELKSLHFTPDNRFVATLSSNKVRLWDLVTYKVVQTIPVKANTTVYGFSQDGRYLVGGTDSLRLWEVRTGREFPTTLYAEGDGNMITSAAFSPDGKYLASGDSKGNIHTWFFSEENVSQQYYSKEIREEIRTIPVKSEFEKTEEYNKRFQKKLKEINERYFNLYNEKVLTEQTLQNKVIEEVERDQLAHRQRILNSLQTVALKIESVGAYNADKETFTIKIVNDQERYSHTETIRVPRKDNPACFKQNFQASIITGTKQLSEDEKSIDIFNIKIRTSCPGKEVEYTFGTQHRPLYME